MIWLVFVFLFSVSALGGISQMVNIKKLKSKLEKLKQWDIHNFKKIELSYVKGNDISAVPSVVDSYFVPSKNVEVWIDDLHLRRSGAMVNFGDKRFFKDGHNDLFLVSIKVSRPHIEHWIDDVSEVLWWAEEDALGWTALKEFVQQLRKDLAYEDYGQGVSSEARISDLGLLMGSDAELEILRIYNGSTDIKKEVFEKMQRIRAVIDVRERAGDKDRHFEFLMSKNVGFDKDHRIVDLLDNDQMLEKICRCFEGITPKQS